MWVGHALAALHREAGQAGRALGRVNASETQGLHKPSLHKSLPWSSNSSEILNSTYGSFLFDIPLILLIILFKKLMAYVEGKVIE